jgi:hypothetical protein
LDNLRLGFNVSEDYAGMGCMTMALSFAVQAGILLQHLPPASKPIRYYRACDVSPLSIKVLGGSDDAASVILNSDERPEHIHVDLNGRLPEDLKKSIDLMEPGPAMDGAERQQCYSNIARTVRHQAKNVFTQEAEAFCTKCKKLCRIRPKKMAPLFSDGDVELPESQRPWSTNHAGHVCIAWSARGKREGTGHSSARPWAIWTSERAMTQEDIVFAECAELFPPSELQKAVPGRLCITIYTGPEQLGWPTRRGAHVSSIQT